MNELETQRLISQSLADGRDKLVAQLANEAALLRVDLMSARAEIAQLKAAAAPLPVEA